MVNRSTNIRWVILVLVLFASFFSYFLRSNLSILGETMINDLGLTEVHLGYIFSAFAAGYALFQLPGGMLGDRFGARFLITAMLVIWTVLNFLTALIPDSNSMGVGLIVFNLMVLRFLVGVTHAPIFPVSGGGTIANWFPVGGWGLPFGLQVAGLSLGAALAAPLLVWLMADFGWRGALLMTTPPAFVLALIWWWYVRDYPKDHRDVNPAELALIDANRTPPVKHHLPGVWKSVLFNRDISILAISYFCMNYVFYLFFYWFFFYLVGVRHFDDQQAGIFTSTQWIVGAVAGLGGGILCDIMVRKLGFRHGPRLLAIVSLLLSGLFLIAGAMATNVFVAVTLLSLSFGCIQIADNPYWIAAIAIAGRHAQVATGILNTGGNVVGFVGGLLVPFLAATFGWTVAVASGAIFAFVGAGLWFLIRVDRSMDNPVIAQDQVR